MIDPTGHWTVFEGHPRNPQSISFDTDGEAWSITCERSNGLPDLLGVGLEHENFLCVARGLVQQNAELGHKVGLVKYCLNTPGELPATWYHCSLNGKLSEGFSSDGPQATLTGEYRADYQSGDGVAFNPLRKTITKRGNGFELSWWDDEHFHYLGVGRIVGGCLFAAWGPPGAIVQFSYYDLSSPEPDIRGSWQDLGRDWSGTEILKRRSVR